MVRFIIIFLISSLLSLSSFTFQYGQIYYNIGAGKQSNNKSIYIPIWLDLLLKDFNKNPIHKMYLHSNMVRFIINPKKPAPTPATIFTFQYGQIYYFLRDTEIIYLIIIYIPIWLDLLFYLMLFQDMAMDYLHSNMVRFIIF